jgi:hypothetical protein
VPAEDFVLVPARTLRATEAAHQQNPNSGGDNQRQQASARNKPMYKTMHKPNPMQPAYDDIDAEFLARGQTNFAEHRNSKWTQFTIVQSS